MAYVTDLVLGPVGFGDSNRVIRTQFFAISQLGFSSELTPFSAGSLLLMAKWLPEILSLYPQSFQFSETENLSAPSILVFPVSLALEGSWEAPALGLGQRSPTSVGGEASLELFKLKAGEGWSQMKMGGVARRENERMQWYLYYLNCQNLAWRLTKTLSLTKCESASSVPPSQLGLWASVIESPPSISDHP